MEGTQHFPVEVAVRTGNRITVFIDGDRDVTVSDCQAISRKLEHMLDRNREDFELTVSSAGTDRPLKYPRQYPKNTGRTLAVVTTGGEQLTGRMVAADEKGFELEFPVKNPKKEKKRDNLRLEFPQVATAKVLAGFGS